MADPTPAGGSVRPALPTIGRPYIAGPHMDEGRDFTGAVCPSWLVGRRIVVRRILTRRQVECESGYRPVASTDEDLRKGRPMPDLNPDPDEPDTIEVAVLARGRVQIEFIDARKWDGVPAVPPRSPA